MATCRGIDVSTYQGEQDWAAHKRAGVVFAFAKASEGQRSRDARFGMHIKGIKAAGLVPGGYHFAWPNQDVAKEAANYVDAAKPYAGKGFTHWLDLERYSDGRNYAGRSSAQIKAWATAWIAAVQKAFPGQRVGVYTSADDIAAGRAPDGVPLWYPAYPGTSVDTYAEAEARPTPSPSGRKPLIWQFTSDPAGSGPRMDLNLAYMSEAAFRAWAAGGSTDEAPKEGSDVPEYVNLGLAKPYTLAPGKWDSIEFTTEWNDTAAGHADGGSVFVRGAARFAGSVSLTINSLPVGDVIQARMSEYLGDELAQDHPIDEVVGTPGGTFRIVPLVKRLGKDRGMRVRLLNQSNVPVTITSAVLTALVFKES
ncbi:glycoside hydrolase family 25 protein [Streptomyces prunicolor]|uniref:glycoside hydrolase family 25 protein n=1 Tax=Streptomyces prunicolor TaxID=67348 RepID=UPI00036C34F6|nr:glycoside hydrolase family 25 protein [Streptomyces prunicolor]